MNLTQGNLLRVDLGPAKLIKQNANHTHAGCEGKRLTAVEIINP